MEVDEFHRGVEDFNLDVLILWMLKRFRLPIQSEHLSEHPIRVPSFIGRFRAGRYFLPPPHALLLLSLLETYSSMKHTNNVQGTYLGTSVGLDLGRVYIPKDDRVRFPVIHLLGKLHGTRQQRLVSTNVSSAVPIKVASPDVRSNLSSEPTGYTHHSEVLSLAVCV